MKTLSKIGLTICCLLICGCVSFKPLVFEEMTFTEVTMSEFLEMNSDSLLKKLYKKNKGYKLINCDPYGLGGEVVSNYFSSLSISENERKDLSNRYNKAFSVHWFRETKEHYYYDNKSITKKFKDNLVFYVGSEVVGIDDVFSLKYSLKIYAIEGIPSAEEIDAEYKELEKIEIEKKSRDELEAKKNIERAKNRLDNQGKKIAKGYIYHGIDEKDYSQKLFIGNALSSGHAYYVSICLDKYYRPVTVDVIDLFTFYTTGYINVLYKDMSVKAELIDTAKFRPQGYAFADVIVAGGPTPMILGVIK